MIRRMSMALPKDDATTHGWNADAMNTGSSIALLLRATLHRPTVATWRNLRFFQNSMDGADGQRSERGNVASLPTSSTP